MKKTKIILTLCILVLAPLILLFLIDFCNVEVEMQVCKDRPNFHREWNSDYPCSEYKTITRVQSLKFIEAVKEKPLLLIFMIIYLVSFICYAISIKKNAYSYIGFEDIGKLGLISIIIYIVNALLLVFIPILLYKQVGTGPIFTMITMFLVPFISRPILVDW